MPVTISFQPVCSLFAILFFLWGMGVAGEKPNNRTVPEKEAKKETKKRSTEPSGEIAERFQVIGSAETAEKVPGSAHFITKEELAKQEHDDVHRVLRSVPGINIQEEDGYGFRPNIGMRGTGVERSQKITVMEDGVLIAPAPYTAPAAYYFPTMGRMESVEVVKGSSSVKQGPYTNGGSLNLISTSIPGDLASRFQALGGSHDTRRYRASVGDAGNRFGWLIEGYQFESHGFKDLDGGGDTGTDLRDFTAKLRLNSDPGANVYQSLELKLGKTLQDGNESYLGLTDADFRRTPNRRYAASALDYIDTDHEQVQLRYFVKPSASTDLTVTAYNNDYFRNWHKLESVRGVSNANVLNRPDSFSQELSILRGEIDSGPGDLKIRNNRRNYYSRGLQTVLFWNPPTGKVRHELEIGARYHEDEEDRFQDDELYQMANGDLILTELGASGSQTNRVSGAEARSFFLQDTMAMGRWTVRPGIRYEHIDYTREDFSTSDPNRADGPTRLRENGVEVWLPGIGLDYQLSRKDFLFLGIHRGFSPPGAGQNENTREETSTNYEFGMRHRGQKMRLELIGFFNDYDNLLGAETVSGGGGIAGELFNGGKVEVSGLEAGWFYQWTAGSGWTMPLGLTYTYTASEFGSSFDTGFADWSPHVEAGDALPYIPENQATAEVGLATGPWRFDLSANYTGEMRTKAGHGPIPAGEEIEDHAVIDFSGTYTLRDKYQFFARVRNLTDETYIVARRPYGVRPGLERTLLFGLSAKF